MKIRKEHNIKVNIAEISKFIGCNLKGIHYIEASFEETHCGYANKISSLS